MARKRETRRQRKIRQTLEREVGGVWFKTHGGPFQDAGLADLIGCVEGLFFAFEVKEPDGDPSELQLDFIKDIEEAGGIAAIVIDGEDAVHLVRHALLRAGKSPQLLYKPPRKNRGRMPSVRTGHRKDNHNSSDPRNSWSFSRFDSNPSYEYCDYMGKKARKVSSRIDKRKRNNNSRIRKLQK